MNVPDPDNDILQKLDRRERRSEILSGGFALVGALIAGAASYELLKRGFHWVALAARDGGAVVFIVVCIGLFLKLNRTR